MDYISNIKTSIAKHFVDAYKFIVYDQIKVTKRNRHLDMGDFIVYFTKLSSDVEVETLLQCSSLKNLVITVEEPPDVTINAFVANSTKENNVVIVNIKLDHNKTAGHLIKMVLAEGNNYGHVTDSVRYFHEYKQTQCVVYCSIASKLKSSPDCVKMFPTDTENISLQEFRSYLVADNSKRLLVANGYKVIIADNFPQHLIRMFDEDEGKIALKNEQIYEINQELIYIVTKGNKYITTVEDVDQTDEQEIKHFDLRSFIADNFLQNYSLNIDLLHLNQGDNLFKIVCEMEYLKRSLEKKGLAINWFNVIPYQLSFQSQINDLAWKMFFPSGLPNKTRNIEVGAIVKQNTSTAEKLPKVNEFLQLRIQQAEEAFKLKYGNIAQSDKWCRYIKLLANAAIKFEFLITNNSNSLKIDLSSVQLDTKGGVFILYNYARLCTLFNNYEKAKANGVYPALPEANNIDFSLLKQNEEWELIFNSIMTYPSVVKESVSNFLECSNKNVVHTHKICQFLQDLSNCFSSYYNRVHVLGEPYPHLFPQMFARLYLLKSIQQIYLNGFYLLNITPVEEL